MKGLFKSKLFLNLAAFALIASVIAVPFAGKITHSHAQGPTNGTPTPIQGQAGTSPPPASSSSPSRVASGDPGGGGVLVPATAQWVNTGITLKVGQTLKVSATGSWSADPGDGFTGPDGYTKAWPDNFLNLQDIGSCAFCASTPTPHWGALIGYIGNSPPAVESYTSTSIRPQAEQVFVVGSSFQSPASPAGTLWFNFNDDAYSGYTIDNAGQVTAMVTVQPASGHPVPQATYSYNFAGYADLDIPAHPAYYDVSASWVQPSAKCTSDVTRSSFWVGLGGIKPNSHLEQAGITAFCDNGQATYRAFIEVTPAPPVYLDTIDNSYTILPDDSVQAAVSYAGSGVFLFAISTQRWHFSHVIEGSAADLDRSSAEWIAEDPNIDCPATIAGGAAVCLLTHFMTGNQSVVTFTQCLADAYPITSRPDIQRIVISTTSTASGTLKAFPLSLNPSGGTAFRVLWQHA